MDRAFGRRTYQDTINFYERKTGEALSNASKYRTLIEKSYISAIESLEKAIEFIEKEKTFCDTDCEKYDVLDAREKSLKSQLQLLQPYRSFLKCHSPPRPSRKSAISRRSNIADTFVFLVDNYNTPAPDHCQSSTTSKLCPKNKEERFEECEIRICELEKMVDYLSRKLQESERRAMAEEDARLVAEGQLLMLSPQNHLTSLLDRSDTSSSEFSTSTHRLRSFQHGGLALSYGDEDDHL